MRELFPDSEDLVASWETDASGRSTGRLGAVTTRWGTTRFVYDGAGRVATVAGAAEELAYGWDGFLATTVTWTGEVNGTVAYGYDADFRVAAVTVAGVTTARSYDADGLLTGSGALALAREAATGRLSGSTLGAVTTSQTYDRYGALSTFTASVSGTEQYRYELTPDAAGRIATKRETIGGTTRVTEYGYDAAGRLWTVRQDGALTATYEYDENGNRVSATTAAGTARGTYDAQDRLLTYGDATYTWGANGELESRTVAGRKTWYAYDRLGNLRNVALPDGGGVEYVLDGLNRRVGRRVNGQLVEAFLYDGQLRPVAWLGALGAVKATFVYGTRVNVPEYMVAADGKTYRILTDHLGSPRLVVDAASGAVAQRMDYDEWGQVVQDTNPGFQPFGFAGGLYDRDSGLVRFGARDYDPSTGRWTNKDPVRFRGGLNLYVYAAGDPVDWTDPSGLYTEVIIWGPQGWDPAASKSLMGHVSVNINGVSYSLTPDDKNGMSIRPFADYLTQEQPGRVGHGVILWLTPEQEQALAAYLEGEPPHSYKKFANNCGAPVQWGLQELGVNLRDFAIRPNTLLEYLLESPYAIGEAGYPQQ